MNEIDRLWTRVQALPSYEEREAVYREIERTHGKGFAEQVRNLFELQITLEATS